MKTLSLAFAAALIASPALAQSATGIHTRGQIPMIGPTVTGSGTITYCPVTDANVNCVTEPKSDLSLILNGEPVVIRKLARCAEIAVRLGQSPDVSKARCLP